MDAAKKLLQYGLKGTDLEALVAIGKGEDGGRFGKSIWFCFCFLFKERCMKSSNYLFCLSDLSYRGRWTLKFPMKTSCHQMKKWILQSKKRPRSVKNCYYQ